MPGRVGGGECSSKVRRRRSGLQGVAHGGVNGVRPAGKPEVIQHQRTGEDRRERVGDSLARQRRCGTVDGLKQAHLTGMQVRAGGEPQPADELRPQVREDVSEQVAGHDDLESLGGAHQFHGEGIHIPMLALDVRE